MSMFTQGVYGAAYYNLPNTFVGSYKSPGVSVKTPCSKFNIRCKIALPKNNEIKLNEEEAKKTPYISFCGVLDDGVLDADALDVFYEYVLKYEDNEWTLIRYDPENRNNGKSLTIKNDASSIKYSPCSFAIHLDFVVNNEIKTFTRLLKSFTKKDESSDIDTLSENKNIVTYTLAEDEIIDLGGEIPSALTYRIDLMTSDNEKTVCINDIEILGIAGNNQIGEESREREGFLIYELLEGKTADENENQTININDITHISYEGSSSQTSSIEVRSKIYKENTANPSQASIQWSDPYLKSQNKVILKDDLASNTKSSESLFRVHYNYNDYFSSSEDEGLAEYVLNGTYSSLIISGGAVLRNPEFIYDQERYYSSITGDLDGDGSVTQQDMHLLPPLGVKLGDKEYVESHDLTTDGVIDESDFNAIYNMINTTTTLGGGYIFVKIVNPEDDAVLAGPFYIHEEGDYKLDLEPYNIKDQSVDILFGFKRFKETYVSPYISLLGVVTDNSYYSSVSFGANKKYMVTLSGDQVDEYGQIKDPKYSYLVDGEVKQQKDLAVNNLPFQLPYWYVFRDTPNDAQNIFKLTMDEEFSNDNPHAKIYLDINLKANQEVYRGGLLSGSNNPGLKLEGPELKQNESWLNGSYKWINANEESLVVTIMCFLDTKPINFLFAALCDSDDQDHPTELNITKNMMTEWVENAENYRYEFKIQKPDTVKLLNDGNENVDSVTLTIGSEGSTLKFYLQNGSGTTKKYFESRKTFNGVANAGDTLSQYRRRIYIDEIPSINKANWLTKQYVTGENGEVQGPDIKWESEFAFNLTPNFIEKGPEGANYYILHSVDVSLNEPIVASEPAKDIIDYASTLQNIDLRINNRQTFTYEELASILGVDTISQEELEQYPLFIETLTDNAKVSYFYTKDGIVVEGREMYDFREDWIPKITNGYYHINKNDYFYNPQRKQINIPPYDSSNSSIATVSGISGKCGIVGNITENLMPKAKDSDTLNPYLYYSFSAETINREGNE